MVIESDMLEQIHVLDATTKDQELLDFKAALNSSPHQLTLALQLQRLSSQVTPGYQPTEIYNEIVRSAGFDKTVFERGSTRVRTKLKEISNGVHIVYVRGWIVS
jgi:hypothetical protein